MDGPCTNLQARSGFRTWVKPWNTDPRPFALVLSDLGETLVQNRLAIALLGDQTVFTGPARSGVHRWFTDPAERRIYPEVDRENHGRLLVSNLRASSTKGGPNNRATAMVRQLREISPEPSPT